MSGDARKPGYHMKWIGHHLKKAMSKFTPTGYGHAHRRNLLAKVVERAYSEAAKHGITAEELTSALAKRMGTTRTVRECDAELAAAQGGGGGRGVRGGLEVGLVKGPTTNLKVVSSQLVDGLPATQKEAESFQSLMIDNVLAKVDRFNEVKGPTTNYEVSSQSQVSDEKIKEAIKANPGIYGPICALPEGDPSKWAWVARTPAVEVKADEMPAIADTTKPPEGPQWPQKASVGVSGPCPNPKVWAGKIIGRPSPNDVSLEANPTRQWKRGEVVEAELIRGGGSPIYRAVS